MSRAAARAARFEPGGRGLPYRRGAVMGLTMAEAFLLIAFALLLLLGLWSVQRDEAEERLAPLAGLTPAEVEAARALSEAGRLEAAAEIAGAAPEGEMPPAPPEGEVWRLVDEDAEARLLDGVKDLPPALKGDLARLVEIADPEALRRALEALAAAPESPMPRLVEAAAGAGPERQEALARIAEAEGPARDRALAAGLAAADSADGSDGSDALAAISARLAGARAGRAALVADLRGTLGATVAAVGGTIEPDGSIVLPDTVLFEQGSARITPVMESFLDGACAPWLGVLRDAAAPVARAQIEGHASTEWRTGTGPDDAYRNNLALSQARSQAVLDACLTRVADPSLRAWAQGHLAAVGYSSAHPVLRDGAEDAAASRRVVFSVGLDDGALLREVEGELEAGLGRLRPRARGEAGE